MHAVRSGVVTLLFFSLVATTSCASHRSQVGGAMGGLAGAVLDLRNPWRGGVIGAAPGDLAEATISDVSVRGARQAALAARPVVYTTKEGRGTYLAEPVGRGARSDCKKVRERTYENERLVSDRMKEVCTGHKY